MQSSLRLWGRIQRRMQPAHLFTKTRGVLSKYQPQPNSKDRPRSINVEFYKKDVSWAYRVFSDSRLFPSLTTFGAGVGERNGGHTPEFSFYGAIILWSSYPMESLSSRVPILRNPRLATLQLQPYLKSIHNTAQQMSSDSGWWSLPEWSPIQILDEEALAAKCAREQQLYEQRRFGTLNQEKS